MSRFILKEHPKLKEKYYFCRLENGMKITVIPKEFPNKTAILCCNFGGADINYQTKDGFFTLPAGTAHFLEHKMFENQDGSDAFLEFDNFGGSANAFTSFENTCYYFSCTENFYENLDVLLKSVSSVHFSDESIEKEKKIIAREIKMYEDSPSSLITRNLSKALYHNHPIVNPISGTVESISEIDKETLFRAYNHFYLPENLSLCVCGMVEPEQVLNQAEKYFSHRNGKNPLTIYPEEPETVVNKEISAVSQVASQLYAIGFKCPATNTNDLESVRKSTAVRLAISLLFGRASDFYCKNYELGLLNERFYAGYTQTRNASYVIVSGSGADGNEIAKKTIEEIELRKKDFFTDEEILREKRAAYAESITLFDNGEDLAVVTAANAYYDYDEFDCIEILAKITPDEIKEALCSINTSNYSVSKVENQ